MLEVAQLRARVTDLSRRRRSAETTADILVELLVGVDSGERVAEQLVSRYERYIVCSRQPALRDIQRRILHQRSEAVTEAVERSGRIARVEMAYALVCMVDGAVMAALVDDLQRPRVAARAAVVDVIDMLAPLDQRAVSA